MKELKFIEDDILGKIRMLVIDGESWFVGKDVAKALGYSNTREAIKRHVDEEDKTLSRIITSGQTVVIINETGLYSLVFGSELPSAKNFKRWIISNVIKPTKRHGGYILNQETMSDEELLAKALEVAQGLIAEKDKERASSY